MLQGCKVGMLLSWIVVVSEWRCVRMAMCPNGDKSGSVLLGYVIYGGKQSDDPLNCHLCYPKFRGLQHRGEVPGKHENKIKYDYKIVC